jgi:hypothetical protein
MRAEIILICIILMFGCIGLDGKDCKEDKQCLIESFEKCEKAYGTWNGENGKIFVKIMGKNGDRCSVSLTINEEYLDISNQSMVCDVPLANSNQNFSTKTDCEGKLEKFFT